MSASSARSDELFEVPKLSHPRSCKAVCGLPHVTNAVNGSELHSLLSELRRTALEPFLTAEHGTGQDFRVSVLASSMPVCVPLCVTALAVGAWHPAFTGRSAGGPSLLCGRLRI